MTRKQLATLSNTLTGNINKRVKCMIYGDLILTHIDGTIFNCGKADKVEFKNNTFYSYWHIYLINPSDYVNSYIERDGIRTHCRPLDTEKKDKWAVLDLTCTLGFDNHANLP